MDRYQLLCSTVSRDVKTRFVMSCTSAQSHPKFASIAAVAPLLFSRQLQMSAEKLPQPMALGEAVEKGIIANQASALHVACSCRSKCRGPFPVIWVPSLPFLWRSL